jgi:hypothetical protein
MNKLGECMHACESAEAVDSYSAKMDACQS